MKQNVEQHDRWVDQLSEYVDNELSRRGRRAVEAHLRSCVHCAAIVEDLRRVIRRAEGLDTASEPAHDLWPGIASRLTPRARVLRPRLSPRGTGLRPGPWWTSPGRWWPPPRFTAGLAGLAAVAVACFAVAWLWQSTLHRSVPAGPAASRQAVATRDGAQHEPDFERTVAGLEREARARLTFDSHVIEVLDENLSTLDVAIANYREALSQAPGDTRMRERLAAAKERKLEVLRQAVTLAAEGTN